MATLYQTERTIINELIDSGVFTSTITSETKRGQKLAVYALQKPATQQRINATFKTMFGEAPQNFQENLLFLSGAKSLTAVEIHVLLATCKAVINAPELQGVTADRVIACVSLVTTVNSEVTEIDERKVRKLITKLFVDRFKLFTVDRPVESEEETASEVEECWDVVPDFTNFVECLVGWLRADRTKQDPTDIQRVNRHLLQHRYLDAKQSPELWVILAQNKIVIESQWRDLQRFYLECGDQYALLLDDFRKPSESRQFYAAIRVAQSLGSGLPIAKYHHRIKTVWQQLYPDATVNLSLVKKTIIDAALATEVNSYMVATPLAKRYVIPTKKEDQEWS